MSGWLIRIRIQMYPQSLVAFVVVVFVVVVFVSYMMSSLGGKETKGKKKKPTVRSAPNGSDKNLDILSVQ